MSKIKMAIASKAYRFLEYWSHQHNIHYNQNILPSCHVGTGTIIGSNVKIGHHTFINHNAAVYSGIIGSFCSIGPNVIIGPEEHPTHFVSTHPMFYHPEWVSQEDRWDQPRDIPVIGNDVWVGCNVAILRGAVIEDGAIIGAGSVVRDRIPAYSIAVGLPAKVVRNRFDEEIVRCIKLSKWWELDEESLVTIRSLFSNHEKFVDHFARNLPTSESDQYE